MTEISTRALARLAVRPASLRTLSRAAGAPESVLRRLLRELHVQRLVRPLRHNFWALAAYVGPIPPRRRSRVLPARALPPVVVAAAPVVPDTVDEVLARPIVPTRVITSVRIINGRRVETSEEFDVVFDGRGSLLGDRAQREGVGAYFDHAFSDLD